MIFLQLMSCFDTLLYILDMVNKCRIYNCRSNYAGENHTVNFSFPRDDDLKKIWVRFVNRKDWSPSNSSVICIKHFEKKYLKMGEGKNRCRLDMSMKPVPTIFDPSTHASSSAISVLKAPIRIPRKSPKKRNVFAAEYVEFVNNDKMKFEIIDETLAPPVYTIAKYKDHIVFYKMEHNELSIPQVTECIKIDDKLHVKLYYKGSPVPLPKWFRHGHDCHLPRKSMLENFPSHIETMVCQNKTVFDELKEVRFKMSPVYAPDIIRFALMLRYASVQSYKLLLDEFRLPSLSLLRKIVTGDIDAEKSAKLLKDEKISSDVCLIFDEIYFQNDNINIMQNNIFAL